MGRRGKSPNTKIHKKVSCVINEPLENYQRRQSFEKHEFKALIEEEQPDWSAAQKTQALRLLETNHSSEYYGNEYFRPVAIVRNLVREYGGIYRLVTQKNLPIPDACVMIISDNGALTFDRYCVAVRDLRANLEWGVLADCDGAVCAHIPYEEATPLPGDRVIPWVDLPVSIQRQIVLEIQKDRAEK
jgi:hypothetical protein